MFDYFKAQKVCIFFLCCVIFIEPVSCLVQKLDIWNIIYILLCYFSVNCKSAMNCCFIPSCPKPANLACYEIPIDVQRREKWLTSINSDQNVLTIADEEIFSICSLHFKQSDYIYLIDDESSKRTISKDAVPSIFPWTCDWDSNYTAEMEVCEPNGNCSQQTDCSQTVAIVGLPEGETVQLGNVESLGINTRVSTEDETCLENSSAHTRYSDFYIFPH